MQQKNKNRRQLKPHSTTEAHYAHTMHWTSRAFLCSLLVNNGKLGETQNMKRVIVIATVVALLVIIIGGTFVYLNQNKPPSLEPVTIGNVPVESFALLYVAENQHLFSENDLNVTIQDYSTGSTALNALTRGEIDIGGSSDYVVDLYAFQKQNISIIASCGESEFFELIGRNDHGINNVSDLNGKTIGTAKNTVASFYLGLFLEANGLSMQNITLVDLTPTEIANAIGNETVDAVVSWELYTEQVKTRLGTGFVEWQLQMDMPFYGVLSCRNDWISQHPETINHLLTALAQAEDYLQSHPTEAQQIIKNRFNYTDSYITTIWARTTFGLSLPQRLVTVMQQEATWIINNNLTTEKTTPTITNYINPDALKAIKPETVNIS